jgi:uncharacterized protein YbaR (Trm112 family)
MLPHHLTDILACPACRGKLTSLEGGARLLCRPCGLGFPVREGIPVMLTDEAKKFGDQGPGTGDRETGI